MGRGKSKIMQSLLGGLLMLAVLGDCSGLSVQAPEKRRFVLEDQARPACRPSPAEAVLLIDSLPPSAFNDSLALAYSRAPGTRDYYQYAVWTDRPATRIALLARDRLRAGCLARQVGLTGDGLRGDYLLTLRLHDFYHDAATKPGTARLLLDVQLIERSTARLLAHTAIRTEASATSYDAARAVAGLDAALTRGLDALDAWLAGQAPFAKP